MSVCDLLYLGIFCFPLEISVLFSSRFSLYFVAVLIKRFPANTLHYELKVCQDNLLSCLLMGDLPACHFPSAMQSAPRRDWLVSIFSFLFSCEQVSGLKQNDQTLAPCWLQCSCRIYSMQRTGEQSLVKHKNVAVRMMRQVKLSSVRIMPVVDLLVKCR